MPCERVTAGQDLVARLRAAGCVFAEDEARLLRAAAADDTDLGRLAAERISGLPLEYVLGWAEFCGLRIAVSRGVFVPRRRTEFLVEQAATWAPRVAVDLCCGSGAVGAALRARCGADVHAVDVDPVAVACAIRNLGDGQVYLGDLYAPLPEALRGRVDVLAVNAPYVPADAVALMPPEAREFEPRAALDGGPDGLDVHRRVAAGARDWLRPGGHLLIETSETQAPVAVALFGEHGLRAHFAHSDEYDATVVIGTA